MLFSPAQAVSPELYQVSTCHSMSHPVRGQYPAGMQAVVLGSLVNVHKLSDVTFILEGVRALRYRYVLVALTPRRRPHRARHQRRSPETQRLLPASAVKSFRGGDWGKGLEMSRARIGAYA